MRTAAAAATGDYVMPFDADLEYLPEEIPEVLDPVLSSEAEVVYGSRTFGSHSAYSFWYVMGNKAVTTAAKYPVQLLHRRFGDLLQAHAPGAAIAA